ncbi:AMP-binding protein [Kitasatospora sp. NPDC048545]|uniref:AMP-binding protein n=1 Tax=Kitasatospora sp. NPDC048545 TaxID=3157208 RepID=UPI0033ECA017
MARQLLAFGKWGLGPAGEVHAAARRSPNSVAVVDEEGQVTYEELLVRVTEVARALQALRATRVGVLCRNHRGALEGMVAALVAGADAVLLNTHLKPAQLTDVALEQRLNVLCHEAEFAGWVDSVSTVELPWDGSVRVHAPRLPTTGSLADQQIPQRGRMPVWPRRRVGRVVVLTAGTTGVPKGAALSRPPSPKPLLALLTRIPLRVGDRVLIAVPLFGTWGHSAVQAALALRATVVMQRRFHPAETLRMLAEERCTVLIAAPVMLEQLLDRPEQTPPGLRLVLVGGAPLRARLATRFMDAYGEVLFNVYGSTEVSCVSVATPSDLRRSPDTAGRPPRGTRVTVLGQDGEQVPTGEVGRIFVSNALLFSGYTSCESTSPGLERRQGMIATGDLGHLDDDGLLFVDGREDEMIVSGGENVFPGPVETLIGQLPQVQEVAVIGVPDATYGQSLAAFIVLRKGAALEAEQVRAHIQAYLMRSSVPRDVTFLPSLPRNPAGKIIPRELPDL